MNFFAAQDKARKNTTRLVVLFLLAVFSLISISNIAVLIAMGYFNPELFAADDFLGQFNWHTFGLISVAITTVIVIGTVYKLLQLSQGGSAVAEMLGGKLIPANTYDYNEKKLINVVTEMAIASGTPVPPVYVMQNEHGINAFAAGYHAGDAVVAVTRGTLETLSRDELQGVIAHEFSHIFNGDMRLNIRLIGILHGILVIGLIGYQLLRFTPRTRHSRSGNGAAPIAAMGIGLMIIGYTGTFFGNLIKSAVSRQREYLADASAVQFTRNPSGIADALKKIGGSSNGSIVRNPGADEISHAFFSEGVSHFLSFMMATHPPLEKRIRALEPGWDGKFITPTVDKETPAETKPAPAFNPESLITVATILASQDAIDSVGAPQKQHLDYARQMLSAIPIEFVEAANSPFSCRALIYFLLLSHDPEIEQQQIDYLMIHADDGVTAATLQLSNMRDRMDKNFRLALINMSLSSLRQLTQRQYLRFIENVDELAKADRKISLFEWTLQKILRHHLDPIFDKQTSAPARYKTCAQLNDECLLLLSVLWHSGHNQAEHIDAFDSALTDLKLTGKIIAEETLKLSDLNAAMDKLALLYPLKKPKLLKACAKVIAADNKVTATESELFRAIAAILDCPMPPIVTGGDPKDA